MNDLLNVPEQDAAVFSRIRLARNFSDLPFSPLLETDEAALLTGRAKAALANAAQTNAFSVEQLNKLTAYERGHLIDCFRISNDLLKFADRAAVLLSKDETISIMTGEEDHLRIFVMLPGLRLMDTAEIAYTVDEWLEKGGEYAFDNQFGYLTANPINAGTGMRGMILLHLPALRAAGQIGRIVQEIAKLGLTLRGFYSDGNEADGNLYQLSNHTSLGRSEEDILCALTSAAKQIIEIERGVREKMLSQDEIIMIDRLFRSIGILRNARTIGQKEWMQKWSDLRLAAVMGMIDAPLNDIDRLMMELQPNSLNTKVGKVLSEREQSIMRADILRKKLAQMPDALIEV